jgi:lipid-binding SYLF domain-containing protein
VAGSEVGRRFLSDWLGWMGFVDVGAVASASAVTGSVRQRTERLAPMAQHSLCGAHDGNCVLRSDLSFEINNDFRNFQVKDQKMTNMRRNLRKFVLVTVATFALAAVGAPASAATAEDLNKDAAQALQTLYRSNPVAESISKQAKAILVFPRVIKAGLVFGGSYGEGVLMKGSRYVDYYNSVSGSWGLQAGAESYSYVVFLTSEKAVKYLEESKGWEIGVGPTVVVVNEGVAKNLSTSTLKNDAYAFIFDQQGLMASLTNEGTKISRIKP